MWATRLLSGAVLDFLREGAGVFAGWGEGESFLQVLLSSDAVIVVKIGASQSQVGFRVGFETEGSDGLVAGLGKPALED